MNSPDVRSSSSLSWSISVLPASTRSLSALRTASFSGGYRRITRIAP